MTIWIKCLCPILLSEDPHPATNHTMLVDDDAHTMSCVSLLISFIYFTWDHHATQLYSFGGNGSRCAEGSIIEGQMGRGNDGRYILRGKWWCLLLLVVPFLQESASLSLCVYVS